MHETQVHTFLSRQIDKENLVLGWISSGDPLLLTFQISITSTRQEKNAAYTNPSPIQPKMHEIFTTEKGVL